MTQEDLKEYLEQHDCHVYKTQVKEDGIYYFMRRNGQRKIAVAFPPSKGVYKQENVCHVCNLLDVQVPNWAQGAQSTLDDVRRDVQNRIDEEKHESGD